MIKKKLLKSRSAQWLAGSTAALTAAHSANATVVRIDYIDHDLTQSLDGLTLFNGVADAGQWAGNPIFGVGFNFYSIGGIQRVNAIHSILSIGDGNLNVNWGLGSSGFGGVENNGGVIGSTAFVEGGLIAWNLSNGTRGWLHVVGDNTRSIITDYFVFDDADDQTRPDHGDDADAFAAAPTTTRNDAVPEPSSLALLGLGAAGILLRRRRAVA